MNRVFLTAVLVASAVTPAAAQLAGMPVWNSPKGGTGVTISGDYGRPNADLLKGNAFGARGTVGCPPPSSERSESRCGANGPFGRRRDRSGE